MSKFTPGPWEVDKEYIYSAMSADSGDGCVADANSRWMVASMCSGWARVEGYPTEFGDEVIKANAALIAAAPDLYDAALNALETLLACVKPAGGCDDQATILNARRMLSEAILKAGGKQ